MYIMKKLEEEGESKDPFDLSEFQIGATTFSFITINFLSVVSREKRCKVCDVSIIM